jgi:hypothetical protein
MLFDEADLIRSMEKIEQINYHQEQEHNGIKFTCYNAGHVLGAAMFLVEIAGTKVLYTGDFSRQEDRHLMGAETPPVKACNLFLLFISNIINLACALVQFLQRFCTNYGIHLVKSGQWGSVLKTRYFLRLVASDFLSCSVSYKSHAVWLRIEHFRAYTLICFAFTNNPCSLHMWRTQERALIVGELT